MEVLSPTTKTGWEHKQAAKVLENKPTGLEMGAAGNFFHRQIALIVLNS